MKISVILRGSDYSEQGSFSSFTTALKEKFMKKRKVFIGLIVVGLVGIGAIIGIKMGGEMDFAIGAERRNYAIAELSAHDIAQMRISDSQIISELEEDLAMQEVLVAIGNRAITHGDFAIGRLNNSRRMEVRTEKDVLVRMMMTLALEQEAERRGIQPEQDVIEEHIARSIAAVEEGFYVLDEITEEYIRLRGITREQYVAEHVERLENSRDEVFRMFLVGELAESVREEYAEELNRGGEESFEEYFHRFSLEILRGTEIVFHDSAIERWFQWWRFIR